MLISGGDWRPWFFEATPVSGQFWEQKPSYWGELLASAPLSPPLAGYVKNYQGNVSFVTVHSSGHMVPQFRPAAALELFRRTLANMLLSPPLDLNQVSPFTHTPFHPPPHTHAHTHAHTWREKGRMNGDGTLFLTPISSFSLCLSVSLSPGQKVATCSDDEFFGTAEGGAGYMGKWIAAAQALASGRAATDAAHK